MICETTDFMFPMLADVYHPIVEQGTYGNVSKRWVLDRTIACSLNPGGPGAKEEITPNIDLTQNSLLTGRVRTDLRISSKDNPNAITNVIVTNIRDASGNPIHMETAGVRKNKSTIFEIATQQPFVGPFGNVEYFKVILRRSDNQAADV